MWRQEMGLYRSWVLPRVLDHAMRQQQIIPFRRQVGGAASGRVLDVGIGSGINVSYYGPNVERVCGIDPSKELLHFAVGRAATSSIPIKLVSASAEILPLDDKSVDTVITTFTLCTIPDVSKALAEIR